MGCTAFFAAVPRVATIFFYLFIFKSPLCNIGSIQEVSGIQYLQCIHRDKTSISSLSCCSVAPPLLCRQDMEQQLGSLILATDISRQNEFLTTFREHLDNQDLDLRLAAHRHFILQVQQHPPQDCSVHSRCQDSLTSASAMCLQIALKCADVCNPCRVWELSRQWSERVCEEFYRQGE